MLDQIAGFVLTSWAERTKDITADVSFEEYKHSVNPQSSFHESTCFTSRNVVFTVGQFVWRKVDLEEMDVQRVAQLVRAARSHETMATVSTSAWIKLTREPYHTLPWPAMAKVGQDEMSACLEETNTRDILLVWFKFERERSRNACSQVVTPLATTEWSVGRLLYGLWSMWAC